MSLISRFFRRILGGTEEISPEYHAFLRAEEELQKRQSPAECNWESWEKIPGFKEADKEYRRILKENVAKEWEAMGGATGTSTCMPGRAILGKNGELEGAWYTPSEVVYWAVKHGKM